MMNRMLAAGLIAGSITFALCNSAVAGDVAVDNSNASLLAGTWKGQNTSVNENYDTPFYTDVQLTIAPGSPMHGEFKTGRGNEWRTPVAFRDGKVVLVGWFARREFTLERGSDNTLRLKAKFEERYAGQEYEQTVNLKKTGKP